MSEIEYPTEVEAAFLVVSDRPRDFVDRMEKLQSLGKYELRPGKKEIIQDRYFDTPENALQALRIALRIREVVGKRFLTLKGPSRSVPSGGVERLEIEEEWSDDAFRKVLEVLRSSNIDIGSSEQATGNHDLIVLMGRHHLNVVQERETERVVKNITHKIGDDHLVVAEMAIDAVKYLFDDIDFVVRIYQIEIEEKDWGSHLIVGELADELEGKFKSDILKWNYGKLATGKAIKELLDECDPKKIVDDEGNLKRSVYNSIENYLIKNDKIDIE